MPYIQYFSSRGGWLWANDVSVPRKVTPGLPGSNFFVQCPGLIFLAARWSGPAASASTFSVCLDYILRVCQSLWDSFLYLENFIGFYICCYPFSTIMACLFSVGVRISWKELCWMRACRRKWHLVFPTLHIIIEKEWIWTNCCKLSRNFVGAIRTTTINCRVSFIDLYSVFPRNFRMILLPHTNTVILLEPYCGNITEPRLPVAKVPIFSYFSLSLLVPNWRETIA